MKTRSPALLAACLAVSFCAACGKGVADVAVAEEEGKAPAAPAAAFDWPQFRGPDRTGVSAEKGLLQQWPKDGPKLLWTIKTAGLGFSSPSIVGDRLYTLGARDDTTYVLCYDIGRKGEELWKAKVGPMFTFDNNTWGDGPRGTPTVDGDRLYALGGFGDLVCVDARTGKELWRTHLEKDLGGVMMSEWGYSESPLVDGDKLVCMPGGERGTLAAFDKKTGKLLWRSKGLKDKATYSSLRVLEVGGVRQYVALTMIDNVEGSAVAGVAADDGRLLWYQRFHKGHSYAVAPTPLIRGDLVYVTAGYGAGCRLLKITGKDGKFEAEEQYSTKAQKSLKNQHGGVVLVGDHVYGHSERLGWVCQDFKTGKNVWEEEAKLECEASGSILAADGCLYLYSDQAEVALLKTTPDGWDEQGRFPLPQKSDAPKTRATSSRAQIWTPPVIANGRLYLRDQELLFCFDVRASK